MNRLSNACKQRDAAREEALLSSEKLAKLQEDIESGAHSDLPQPYPAAQPSRSPLSQMVRHPLRSSPIGAGLSFVRTVPAYRPAFQKSEAGMT